MKNIKFYDIISDSDKKYLSLNFILSEKIFSESFISNIDVKSQEERASSFIHYNSDFDTILFVKHISRYIQDIDEYKKELL